MANVRLPKLEEIGALVEMSRLMSDESPNYQHEEFDAEGAERIVKHIIETQMGVVAESAGQLVGMIGGFIVKAPMHKYMFLTDMGIYIKPGFRGGSLALKLVRAFEDIAAQRGINKIVLGVSTGIDAERTTKLYEKLGYTMLSYGMVKNV